MGRVVMPGTLFTASVMLQVPNGSLKKSWGKEAVQLAVGPCLSRLAPALTFPG